MFLELMRESVIIQGVIVLFLFVTVVVMMVMQIPVPDQLWTFLGIVIGYYFGSDKVSAIKRILKAS